jgi:hypothetical protein
MAAFIPVMTLRLRDLVDMVGEVALLVDAKSRAKRLPTEHLDLGAGSNRRQAHERLHRDARLNLRDRGACARVRASLEQDDLDREDVGEDALGLLVEPVEPHADLSAG